jgi:hypothetical protein
MGQGYRAWQQAIQTAEKSKNADNLRNLLAVSG